MSGPGAIKPRLLGITTSRWRSATSRRPSPSTARFFTFTPRGRAPDLAFVDHGDQFLALAEGLGEGTGGTPTRHLGLVVGDREAVRPLAEAAGATILPCGVLDFLDPWDNRVEVVEHGQVRFTKAAAVLAAMRVDGGKDEKAAGQLRDKGMSEGGCLETERR